MRAKGTSVVRSGSESESTVARVDRILSKSPLQAFFRWRANRALAVVAYHGIDDQDTFTRQLDYLCRNSNPVSLDEVLAAARGSGGLPKRAVLITFDDADRTLLENAVQPLIERGLPAVAFVIAGHLDGEEPFWWSEVEDLIERGGVAPGLGGLRAGEVVRRLKRMPDNRRRAVLDELRRTSPVRAPAQSQLRREELPWLESVGIGVGNHTMTHPLLPRCSGADVRSEIAEAHSVLTAAMGRHPPAFAYPNGDWDPRAERVLKELDYGAAFLFDHALARVPLRHPLRVSRVRVGSRTSVERLALVLSGFHPMMHRARSRLVGRVP